jgi:hypothetical protein
MTAAALLAGFRTRGVTITKAGEALRMRAPTGVVTEADRAAVRARRAELLELLGTAPATPCGLCNSMTWTWLSDWPEPGAGRWVCGICIRRPLRMLAQVYAELTEAERRRLAAEVAAGDALARYASGSAMLVRCTACSGIDWRSDLTGEGERCTKCSTWSPCSLPLEGSHACGAGAPSANAPRRNDDAGSKGSATEEGEG